MPHLRQTCGMAAGATKGSSIILCLLTHHPRELCNACLWALLPCCTQRCDLLCVTYVNHWHGEIQANDKLVSNDCRLFFYHISCYLEVLHKPLYFLFFASFRLLGSLCKCKLTRFYIIFNLSCGIKDLKRTKQNLASIINNALFSLTICCRC